jgi:hypothetical protein
LMEMTTTTTTTTVPIDDSLPVAPDITPLPLAPSNKLPDQVSAAEEGMAVAS